MVGMYCPMSIFFIPESTRDSGPIRTLIRMWFKAGCVYVGVGFLVMTGSWRNQFPYLSDFGEATDHGNADDTTAAVSPNAKNMPPLQQTTLVTTPLTPSTKVMDASCYCGRVRYQVCGDPESSKLCHCRGCQKLHGAPFEWVSIFHKNHVRFQHRPSLDYLYFYSSELDRGWEAEEADHRILPCKVSCSHCRTPIADEGRHMWLAFNTLFDFGTDIHAIPDAFRHSCHLFYNQRCIDLPHDMVKWEGHKGKSAQWTRDK